MLLLLIGIAFGYPEIRPAPSHSKWTQTYRKRKEKKGTYTSDVACEEFAEGISLCYRYVKGEYLPYVLQNDLQRWDATLEQLRISSRDTSAKFVTKDRYSYQRIPNVSGGYWASSQKDGWDSAGLLHPEKLEALLGAKPLVAVPQAGMFLFWPESNPQLSKAVAIGVKEIYNQASIPVSPYVYHWSQGKWIVWGEAVERTE
jgi:hypothetical protein